MVTLILIVLFLAIVMVLTALLSVNYLLDRHVLRALATFTLTIATAVAWWWFIVRL